MKLRLRISLIILGLLLLGQGFYSGVYYFMERRAALTETHRRAMGSVRLAVSICREAGVTGDWKLAVERFRIFRIDPAVSYADCSDAFSRVLVHTDPRKVGGLAAKGVFRTKVGFWAVSHSLHVPGRKPGVARIVYDAGFINEAIHKRLLRTLWTMARVSSSTLLLGVLIALIVARTLTRPVEALAKATREISAGNLEHRLPDDGSRDELGVLRENFNEMAERLGELDKMKKQFVATFTHDLKNPLASIKACLETLAQDDFGRLSPKQKEYVEGALASSGRLWDYIDNILDVMKLQAGQFPMKIEPVAVKKIVDAALKNQEPKARECGVRLGVELAKGLPKITADSDLIGRVFDNLITNAIKFTPEGGSVTVAAKKDGRRVRFEVRDSGAGIPAGQLGKVFEDFYQVAETQKRARERGSGLGLTMCRRIIDEHEGRIWAKSKLDKGTSFFFTLPAA